VHTQSSGYVFSPRVRSEKLKMWSKINRQNFDAFRLHEIDADDKGTVVISDFGPEVEIPPFLRMRNGRNG